MAAKMPMRLGMRRRTASDFGLSSLWKSHKKRGMLRIKLSSLLNSGRGTNVAFGPTTVWAVGSSSL